MADAPVVSIALAVLNGGHDVLPAIQSLLDQSFANWELIVLDDGSTDGTPEALRRLTDPRIRIVVDGLNRGLSARLNQAICLARGRYFARMDHDDVAHPDRLARQVAFLDVNQDVDILATRCLAMSENETIVGEVPFAETHAEICRRPWLGFYMAHPTWMGRTDWFRRHLYADPGPYCCEDQELLLRAHTTSRFHALPQHLMAYRVRDRVSLGRLFRTRLALVRVQAAYFFADRQRVSVLLALAAFALRSALDVVRQLQPRLRSDIRASDPSNWSWWEEMIAANRIRAEAP